MSILRRITLILFGLLFITIISVTLLAPHALTSIVARVDEIATPVRVAAAIAVDVIILLLLFALIRRRQVINKGGLVVKSRSGNVLADVSTESARDHVLKAVRDVPDVISAEARLDAIDGKADIDMDVVVRGEQTNVPEKHAEIDRALRQVIVKQFGLQLANRPRVHIRLQGHDEVVAEPLVEPMVPVAPSIVSAPVIPPPAPIAPPPVVPPPVTPLDDVTPVGDEEVTAMYGLIGRRTAQVKAVPVPPEPVVIEPERIAEPDVPVTPEPIVGEIAHPEEPPAPVVSGWYEQPAPESEPTDEVEEEFYATLRSLPQAEDVMPPASEPESNPVADELASLDEMPEPAEDRNSPFMFSLPSAPVEESTLITETPHEPVDSMPADSTSAPPSGLYDDNDDEEPEFDGDDTRNGSTPR